MVGVMVSSLFGTSLHAPLLFIEMCWNALFCILSDPSDARRQLLLS